MNAMQLAVSNLLRSPPPQLADTHKHCRRCHEDKHKSEFRVKSNGQLVHICKQCAIEKPQTQQHKKCLNCGTDIFSKTGRKIYCDERCRYEHGADRVEKVCWCGTKFQAKLNQVHCSKLCRNRASESAKKAKKNAGR